MIKREFLIRNLDETESFGLRLAEEAEPGDVIALIGDLGTGKTALTKAIAKGLGVERNVTSPTFTIVQEYTEGRIPLFHFDVYRLADSEEMFQIGAEEYFYEKGGLCVIEWADIVSDILPENTQYIYIEYGVKEGERIYRCTF